MNYTTRAKWLLLEKIRTAGAMPVEDATLIGVEPKRTLVFLKEMVSEGTIVFDDSGDQPVYRAIKPKEDRPNFAGIGFTAS